MRHYAVLAVLACVAAVSAETITTADGLVIYQCPDALTAENAYADESEYFAWLCSLRLMLLSPVNIVRRRTYQQ